MLTRAGFELAPSGYRFAYLPVELSSPRGLEASFIQFKCTRYSRDNLTLIHEWMCSVSMLFQNHPRRYTRTDTFHDNLTLCQSCQIMFSQFPTRAPFCHQVAWSREVTIFVFHSVYCPSDKPHILADISFYFNKTWPDVKTKRINFEGMSTKIYCENNSSHNQTARSPQCFCTPYKTAEKSLKRSILFTSLLRSWPFSHFYFCFRF